MVLKRLGLGSRLVASTREGNHGDAVKEAIVSTRAPAFFLPALEILNR